MSPATAFAEIAREQRFLAAWILTSILFIAPMIALLLRAGPMQLFGSAALLANSQPGLASASPQEIAEAMALLFQIVVIVMPIIAIPLTAACLIPMVHAMRCDAGFRPLLAVTAYAAMPPALGISITAIAVLILRDPARLSFESLAPLNLGRLVPVSASRLLHNLTSTLEFFSAWSVYLLAHGVAAASGAGFRRVLLALAVPLLLFAWLLAGLAAVL